jgi:hypothetical protein
MSLGEKILKQIFSETEDIHAVFEVLPTNKVGDYKILDQKKTKADDLLPFLNTLALQVKGISSAVKDQPMEIIANTTDFTFLIAPFGTDGSNLVVMLKKEGNIGLVKMIVHKTISNYKSK